jgi:hypothetical protein
VRRSVADVSAYENTNPDGAQIDTNPYGLLALPGHRLVTDAGGNSLLDVKANGRSRPWPSSRNSSARLD